MARKYSPVFIYKKIGFHPVPRSRIHTMTTFIRCLQNTGKKLWTMGPMPFVLTLWSMPGCEVRDFQSSLTSMGILKKCHLQAWWAATWSQPSQKMRRIQEKRYSSQREREKEHEDRWVAKLEWVGSLEELGEEKEYDQTHEKFMKVNLRIA